jgi:hypothetical protein
MKKIWTVDTIALCLAVAACYLAIALYISSAAAQESTATHRQTTLITVQEIKTNQTLVYWNDSNQVMLWTTIDLQDTSSTMQLYTDWLSTESLKLAFSQKEFTVPGYLLLDGKAHYAELELKFTPTENGWHMTISTEVESDQLSADSGVKIVASLELSDLTDTNVFTISD